MTETKPVILSKISANRKIAQLEYVCDICYENPRLKRRHKSHYHGGGNLEIDWSKRQSFGTRVPHCSHIYVEYTRDGSVSPATNELIRSLPEVELIYDPDITEIPFCH